MHDDVFTIGDRHFRWEYPGGKQTLIPTYVNNSIKENIEI